MTLSVQALALVAMAVGAAAQSASVCSTNSRKALGDDVPICVGIGGVNLEADGTTFKRAGFKVGLDEFSRIELTDSWAARPGDALVSAFGNDVGIHVEAGGLSSFTKLYRSTVNDVNVTFPYFTIIVAMDDGLVESLTWDDGCHFCASSSCTDATFRLDGTAQTADVNRDCFLSDALCVQASTVSEACLLTVYVVFSGTDSNGISMEASNLRFSRFRAGNLDDFRESTESTYVSAASAASDTADSV